MNQYAWRKFNLGAIEKTNPFYTKVWADTFPTRIYMALKNNFIRYNCGGEDTEEKELYLRSTWLFDDESNFLKIFVLKATSLDMPTMRASY